MSMHDKPRISPDGWRIINCLRAFLSTHEIHDVITQYKTDNNTGNGKPNIGYEGILRFHFGVLLADVFGRKAVLAEVVAKKKRNARSFYDLLVKEGSGAIAIELKAYENVRSYKERYLKDFSSITKFVANGRGVANESHNEAFFVHYNHASEGCQTKTIFEIMRADKYFDGTTSYVITENQIMNVDEEGWDTIAPSFFLTFHRADIDYNFN